MNIENTGIAEFSDNAVSAVLSLVDDLCIWYCDIQKYLKGQVGCNRGKQIQRVLSTAFLPRYMARSFLDKYDFAQPRERPSNYLLCTGILYWSISQFSFSHPICLDEKGNSDNKDCLNE